MRVLIGIAGLIMRNSSCLRKIQYTLHTNGTQRNCANLTYNTSCSGVPWLSVTHSAYMYMYSNEAPTGNIQLSLSLV